MTQSRNCQCQREFDAKQCDAMRCVTVQYFPRQLEWFEFGDQHFGRMQFLFIFNIFKNMQIVDYFLDLFKFIMLVVHVSRINFLTSIKTC